MTFDDQGFYVNNVFTARADRSYIRVHVKTISTSVRWDVHPLSRQRPGLVTWTGIPLLLRIQ